LRTYSLPSQEQPGKIHPKSGWLLIAVFNYGHDKWIIPTEYLLLEFRIREGYLKKKDGDIFQCSVSELVGHIYAKNSGDFIATNELKPRNN
jgi:hypothetical protein